MTTDLVLNSKAADRAQHREGEIYPGETTEPHRVKGMPSRNFILPCQDSVSFRQEPANYRPARNRPNTPTLSLSPDFSVFSDFSNEKDFVWPYRIFRQALNEQPAAKSHVSVSPGKPR